MLINYYSQYDFDELQQTEKWNAYLRLRNHSENLQKKLDIKAERIESKLGKIDYLKQAKAELLRQQVARNLAGANARNANYTSARMHFISVYLELEVNRNRDISEAEAGNWEAPSKRITAAEVLDTYSRRYSGQLSEIKLATARKYLSDFKANRDIAPELEIILN
jgi:hypothetical protein